MRRCMVFSLYKLCQVNGNNVKFDVWLLQMLWCFTLLYSELCMMWLIYWLNILKWKELKRLLICSINIEFNMGFNPHFKGLLSDPVMRVRMYRKVQIKSKELPRVEKSTIPHKTGSFCLIIAAGISRVDRMTVRTASAQIINLYVQISCKQVISEPIPVSPTGIFGICPHMIMVVNYCHNLPLWLSE